MSSKWQDVGMCYEQAVLVHLRVSLIYIYVYLCIICIMAAGSLDGKKNNYGKNHHLQNYEAKLCKTIVNILIRTTVIVLDIKGQICILHLLISTSSPDSILPATTPNQIFF